MVESIGIYSHIATKQGAKMVENQENLSSPESRNKLQSSIIKSVRQQGKTLLTIEYLKSINNILPDNQNKPINHDTVRLIISMGI